MARENTVGRFLEFDMDLNLPENNMLWLLRHVPLEKFISNEEKRKDKEEVKKQIIDLLEAIDGNGEIEELIEAINNPEIDEEDEDEEEDDE